MPKKEKKKKKKKSTEKRSEEDIDISVGTYELHISEKDTSEVPLLGTHNKEDSEDEKEEEEGVIMVTEQEHNEAVDALRAQLKQAQEQKEAQAAQAAQQAKDQAVKDRENQLMLQYQQATVEFEQAQDRRRDTEVHQAVQDERKKWRNNEKVCEDISQYLSHLAKKASKKDTKVAPLTHFSDATDDAAQFINRLEQHFLAHDIDQGGDKVNVALSYLKGGAYYRFFSEYQGKVDWEAFKKSFQDHYLSKQVKEIQRQTLVSKKMKPSEDFDQYLNSFLKLGKSAGLNDKALAQQLSDNLPPLYQSHLVGVEKEKLDSVVEKVRIAIQAEELRKQGNSKHVSSVQCDEDLSQILVAGVHSLGQRVEALSEKLESKPEKTEVVVRKESRPVNNGREKFKGNMRAQRPPVLLCHQCGKPGHFRNECYHNPKNQKYGQPPGSKPRWQGRRNDYNGSSQWRKPRYRPEGGQQYQPANNMQYQQPAAAPVYKTPVFTLANPSLQSQPAVQQGQMSVNGAVPQTMLPIEGSMTGEQRPIQYIPVQQVN